MKIHITALALIFFVTGCATTSIDSLAANKAQSSSTIAAPVSDSSGSSAATSFTGDDKTSLDNLGMASFPMYTIPNTSLLKSGKSSLSQDALNKILSSRVVLPKKGHLAIMRFPGPEHAASDLYGRNYLRSESYLKADSYYVDTLTTKLKESDRIIAVTLLPALLAPMDAGIPELREASVRLQADMLLAFRISSDTYNQSEHNIVKAFSTFEAVLMDIRTGLIPYTTVVTRDSEQHLNLEDNDINDARIRAEKEAILASISVVANEITEFLRSVP